MLRIALVGHSQLPTSIDVPGTEIEIFRAPGGKALNFFEDDRLNEVLNWRGDLIILWIGSNDITVDTDVVRLRNEIVKIKQTVESRCQAQIIFVLLEPRQYNNHYPVGWDQYNKIQNSINKFLIKKLPLTRFLQFNTSKFQTLLSQDGVHFNGEGKQLVIQKIKQAVSEYMN